MISKNFKNSYIYSIDNGSLDIVDIHNKLGHNKAYYGGRLVSTGWRYNSFS